MSNTNHAILLVDDEKQVLETELVSLNMNGFQNVVSCSDSRKVLDEFRNSSSRIVVLDITMPHVSGIDLLQSIIYEKPDTIVIMLTGINNVDTAVECMRKGAFDYIVKPINQTRLLTSIQKAVEHIDILEESERLKHGVLHDSLKNPAAFHHIITKNRKLHNNFKYIEAIAPTTLPVLISGETGTGKELLAQAVHIASGAKGEFVSVNCAGIDDNMFSDSLFGHVKGAFTSAGQSRDGLIKQARGGTLFLDEIGDLKQDSQVKLLRLLQEGTYYQIGSDVVLNSRTRFVTATNVDLHAAQANGRFRTDLYYRLQSHQIRIPPLQERKEDVPLLVEYFLMQASEEMHKKKPAVPPELYPILDNYGFPGNVRELKGMVYDAFSLHTGNILSCQPFKNYINKQNPGLEISVRAATESSEIIFPSPMPSMKQMEKAMVTEALKRAKGNKTLAAGMLGMARQTFRAKIKNPDK